MSKKRMKKLSIFVSGLLCLLSMTSLDCKSGFFGTISGKVIDPEYLRPLTGVKVRLDDQKFTIDSDNGGNFSFSSIPSGNHTITCMFANPMYEDAFVEVIVQPGIATSPVTVVAEINSDVIHESRKDSLKLSSLKPGYMLYKGGYALGTGHPLTNSLVLVHDKKRRLILRSTNLKGSVLLQDSSQAIEYARLFTNIETFYLFKDPSPDNSFIELRPATGKPSYGEMTKEELKRLGMRSPWVVHDADHFYITRYLLSTLHNLYKVDETIGFDGDYQIKKTLILSHMDIPLPPIPTEAK